MPMPHRTFAEVAKRRLVGKEGSERVATIRALLGELPGYRNGPYADLRKWLEGELDRTRMRAKVVHRDSLQVRREGAAQIAFVGPPNAGKSSLLQALSQIQIKTGDYAFTTLRPVPALTRIGGVLVQLVEIPGSDRRCARGSRRRPRAARRAPQRRRDRLLPRGGRAGGRPGRRPPRGRGGGHRQAVDRRSLTKADELDAESRPRSTTASLAVSVLDDESLDRLREAIWAPDGADPGLPAPRRRGRRGAVRAAAWRDRGRPCRPRPPRARCRVRRRA